VTIQTSFGYIYLFHATGTNRYKIGLTQRTPEERLKEVNSKQSPFPVEYIESIYTDNVVEVEKELHQRFADNNVHKEWFEFSEYEIDNVINIIKEYEYQQPGYQPEYSYSSDDSSSFGNFIGCGVVGLIILTIFGTFSSGIKREYNEKLATPEEIN